MVMVTGGAFLRGFIPEEDREWVVDGLAEAGSRGGPGDFAERVSGLDVHSIPGGGWYRSCG